MSTRILDVFKHIKPNLLGRWTNHNHKQTMIKINYANEDNCGISGNYKPQKNVQLEDIDYIYIMGYETVHTK
jgi:hypothetical protein